MIKNLCKAAVSVALSPVALIADTVTLPSSGYNGRHPFEMTSALLGNAGKCVKRAIKPLPEYDLRSKKMTLDIGIGVVIIWTMSALSLLLCFKAELEGPIERLILLIISICLGYWGFVEADPETEVKRAAYRKEQRAKELAEQTPHVIREADGCKVYAFKSGDRWHYFTRCPSSSTVTDTTFEVCTGSGKTRSCHEEHSSIETK